MKLPPDIPYLKLECVYFVVCFFLKGSTAKKSRLPSKHDFNYASRSGLHTKVKHGFHRDVNQKAYERDFILKNTC